MQRREKILLAIVGLMLAAFAGLWGAFRLRDSFAAKQAIIIGLADKKDRIKLLNEQQEQARAKLDRLAEKALPAHLGTAEHLYQVWLDKLVHKPEVNLESVRVGKLGEPTADKAGFTRLKFQVIGEGTLAQLTHLLEGFYRADHLHKITNLLVAPKKDSTKLMLTIMIEALSFDRSKNKDKLSQAISPRLNHDNVQAYLDRIPRRNFFGYNRKPELLVARSLTATPGKEFKFTLKATDPESRKLKYSLENSKANGLKLGPDGHIIIWEKPQLGSFDITVRVEDDGDPPLFDQKTITINVRQPKVAPEFNHLRFAILEGLVLVGDTPEAWVTVRTTDKHYKLHANKEQEIAGVKVKVLAINPQAKTIDIEVSGFRRTVRLGESLAQGREGV